MTAGRVPDIVDDFPDIIPVTSGELDAIDTYLGAALDGLFAQWKLSGDALGEGRRRCNSQYG